MLVSSNHHLQEVDSSLVGSCCETGHVADDAASQRQEGASTVQSGGECFVPDRHEDLHGLVLLAIWQDHCVYLLAGICQRRHAPDEAPTSAQSLQRIRVRGLNVLAPNCAACPNAGHQSGITERNGVQQCEM